MTALVKPIVATSPVKTRNYYFYLENRSTIRKNSGFHFFSQWYAFSAFMPDMLSRCILKAKNERERINLVKNLYSELGLDTNTKSHPEMLRDLIILGYNRCPKNAATNETAVFLNNLRRLIYVSDHAYNSGVMLALEAVAYDILDVLKEILIKSGNKELVKHPYITIHEKIEAEHIAHTEDSIDCHLEASQLVDQGYNAMMELWMGFWSDAYLGLSIHA